MKRLLQNVDAQLPQYNDYLLHHYRKEQLAKSEEYIATVLKEAVKLFNGRLTYENSRVLTPEERTEYETKRGNANINNTELLLVEYSFRYDEHKYTSYLYLPYLKDGYIVIKDTLYLVMLAISDKVFTKIKGGVACKVVRSPIKFWKNHIFIMTSVTSKEQYFETLITMQIHWRKSKRKKVISPTVIHYLLAKYGFNTVLGIFDIKPEQVLFSEIIDEDIDQFEYFVAKGRTRVKRDLYLKVDKRLLANDNTKQRRVIACILYLLTNFNKHTINDLYDDSCAIYKIMLGKIIHGPQTVDPTALNYMNDHLDTLDSYLDPITQNKLMSMGVHCNNVFDLLIHVFWHIDEMMLESHSNLYDKRIDVLDMLLGPTIVTAIYHKFYKFERRRRNIERQVKELLSFPVKKITGIYSSSGVRMSTSRYNCNTLLVDTKKTRMSVLPNSTFMFNAPELRFHPSFLVVESAIAFSQNNPGITGTINPFVPTDSDGNIIKPDYAEQIDAISPYLPYKHFDDTE